MMCRYLSYMLYYFNKKNYGYFIGKVMDHTGASRAEVGHRDFVFE